MTTFLKFYQKIVQIVKENQGIKKSDLAKKVAKECKVRLTEAFEWVNKAEENGIIKPIEVEKTGKRGRPPTCYITRVQGRRIKYEKDMEF